MLTSAAQIPVFLVSQIHKTQTNHILLRLTGLILLKKIFPFLLYEYHFTASKLSVMNRRCMKAGKFASSGFSFP